MRKTLTNYKEHIKPMPRATYINRISQTDCKQTDKQTDRQTDGQTKQTDRRTDTQTDQTHRWTDRQTTRHTDKLT